eukprot:scaffold2949_cov92-Skeletonema_dohrnii-CCMP3373.AAC.6
MTTNSQSTSTTPEDSFIFHHLCLWQCIYDRGVNLFIFNVQRRNRVKLGSNLRVRETISAQSHLQGGRYGVAEVFMMNGEWNLILEKGCL